MVYKKLTIKYPNQLSRDQPKLPLLLHSYRIVFNPTFWIQKIQIYLRLNKEKKVENLSFEGSGCAISMASTSIMTELVKGKSIEVSKKIVIDFLNMIKNTSEIKSNDLNEDQKIKIMSLSGVRQYPMRVKCATLAWHTLTSAIEEKKEEVNTEVIE